ncbi:hypothetical protein [Ramlibacter sp.]|uniref:hypothetical protein n=1 Tax=Ramlibacter sp. TaxID=1917967 RepID=UPI002FC72E81
MDESEEGTEQQAIREPRLVANDNMDRDNIRTELFTQGVIKYLTVLRIQPGQEVKRALAPWTRRFGTVVPVFTSLEAEASDLLDAPEEAAHWLREHPLLCCAVPVMDDLLIAARGMTAQAATSGITRAARELAYAAAALAVAASQRWPGAQIPWADPKNRPTLRLVAQAIDFALAAQDHERALAWMRWMLGRDADDAELLAPAGRIRTPERRPAVPPGRWRAR